MDNTTLVDPAQEATTAGNIILTRYPQNAGTGVTAMKPEHLLVELCP